MYLFKWPDKIGAYFSTLQGRMYNRRALLKHRFALYKMWRLCPEIIPDNS